MFEYVSGDGFREGENVRRERAALTVSRGAGTLWHLSQCEAMVRRRDRQCGCRDLSCTSKQATGLHELLEVTSLILADRYGVAAKAKILEYPEHSALSFCGTVRSFAIGKAYRLHTGFFSFPIRAATPSCTRCHKLSCQKAGR